MDPVRTIKDLIDEIDNEEQDFEQIDILISAIDEWERKGGHLPPLSYREEVAIALYRDRDKIVEKLQEIQRCTVWSNVELNKAVDEVLLSVCLVCERPNVRDWKLFSVPPDSDPEHYEVCSVCGLTEYDGLDEIRILVSELIWDAIVRASQVVGRYVCDCSISFLVGGLESDVPSQEELAPLIAMKMREALAVFDRSGAFDFTIDYHHVEVDKFYGVPET